MRCTIACSLTIPTVALLGIILSSCKREERETHVVPPAANTTRLPFKSDLHAGPATQPTTKQAGLDVVAGARTYVRSDYDRNAYAMSQGKLLFDMMNCSGCHAH